jgi:23S rRNA (adenine-N6)-dimethyltransferase
VSAEARTRWGWHQLADPWAQRLVDGASIERGDLVLDVGAGHGAITAPLVAAGARVIAFELHPLRAAELRRRFHNARVVVVQCDVGDLRLPRGWFRVVANPPFGATTALLRRLLSDGSKLLSCDLVVPRHVARRWASPDAPGAARWRTTFDANVGRTIPPDAFRPRATVPVLCLHIRRRVC